MYNQCSSGGRKRLAVACGWMVRMGTGHGSVCKKRIW